MYHLGWFLGNGFGIQSWLGTLEPAWSGSNLYDWVKPDLYVDLASSLERAGFDYILIEDTAMVEDTLGGTAETTLKRGIFAPKNDPLPLVPLMTQRSKHIGIISTVSTIQYPPYLAARLFTTLDHLTEGRVGMNVVTSVTDRVAQNFGYEQHLDHDERYVLASEWSDVVRRLQTSWEPGAVLADVAGRGYADYTKVHTIDFKGKYFSCRGPLNTIPGPQGTTLVASAGNSPAGRDFAARFADTMLVAATSVEQMKRFRADMHTRLAGYNRRPQDFKMLFIVMPVIAGTETEAIAKKQAMDEARWSEPALDYALWNMSYVSGGRVDFRAYDLDRPVSDLMIAGGNGERVSMENIFKDRGSLSLREIAATRFSLNDQGMVGSPEFVASRMDEIMNEVGGDGFLFYLPTTRRDIADVADGLAPVLQRRGSIRKGYDKATFRENLLAF
ncbi:NtaA/DmoA family FMN-dependent monooxygenase [Lichenicoccus sp.]|uniref:NtaA/DmoA family FMN-dependent monooxygenase n=1 Tax=Lichenicoccus sp. TaxID=2781899 RepID=UPI003D0AAF13